MVQLLGRFVARGPLLWGSENTHCLKESKPSTMTSGQHLPHANFARHHQSQRAPLLKPQTLHDERPKIQVLSGNSSYRSLRFSYYYYYYYCYYYYYYYYYDYCYYCLFDRCSNKKTGCSENHSSQMNMRPMQSSHSPGMTPV